MIYLANPSTPRIRAAMSAGHIGMVNTPQQGNLLPAGAVWCADNNCFSDSFDERKWWAFLERNTADAGTCLFAVAPDVVADASASLARSLPWLPKIRALGYRAALAAQDGLEHLTVPWDAFDVLFIGGSTQWKLSPAAADLARQAKARGKWVHMGRVNSQSRYNYARFIGCDSADGTYLVFGPDTNLPNVLSWVRSAAQGDLFGGAA